MVNSDYEEFIYTTSLLYHWFNNQDKILELYKNNDQNVKLVKLINAESKKLTLNSHFSNHLKYRPMLLFSDQINLFLDVVIKNSYFSLKPHTKPKKCSIIEIVNLKELNYFGLRAWYPSIMYKPYNNLNFYTTKLYIERLNRLNNYIKEVL